MALPIPVKTWYIETLVSDLTGNDELNQSDLVFQIKTRRKALGHEVAGSGNETDAGMDGEDRWSSRSDIYGNFQGGAGSQPRWMVFTQPGSGAQDCIVHYGSGESDWEISHSVSGSFTGGGVGVAPTAPDQNIMYSNSFFGRDMSDGGHDLPYIGHIWVSSDLTCFRQVFFWNNNHFGSTFFDAVEDPSPGWTTPNYGVVDKFGFSKSIPQGCGSVDTYAYEIDGPGTGMFWSWGPGGSKRMAGTIDGTGIGEVSGRTAPLMDKLVIKNSYTGTYRHIPTMGLIRNPAFSDPGWHGRMVDVWWVPDNFNPGDVTNLAGSKEFVIFKNQLMKWNGTDFRTE